MAFDATISGVLDTQIGLVKDQAIEKIVDALPIAFGLLVCVVITFAVIKYFRAIVHV